jgi:DUF1009 family protein
MAPTLGLIAGSGRLPFEVAEAARERGLPLAILAIEHNTDPAIESLATAGFTTIAAGELQRLIDFFTGAGAGEVILAGAVAKREMLADPAALKPDARALAAIARLQHRGDDALLRTVAEELESEGLSVISSTGQLRDRLTAEGILVGGPLEERVMRDLELGLRVAKTLGHHDVGQSVAVKDGTVLAVEALEGTDAMMQRASRFAAGGGAVVVKAAKPGQDLRFDVPAIGRTTIEVAQDCGVHALGLEAGVTIVLEREATLRAAERAGIAIVGLRAEPS